MAEDRLKTWERLFQHALSLIDSTTAAGMVLSNWSFGGGTVLMRRHHHRFSKDIDIFVPDPSRVLTPRLNDAAEALTTEYIEQANSLKLVFPEGEIDFVASAPLTLHPSNAETIFGRAVQVETSTEIIAKKIWHRGSEFTARDIFDFAMVAEKEPRALHEIRPVLRERREAVLQRIAKHHAALQETFALLDVLDYKRTFDECLQLTQRTLDAA